VLAVSAIDISPLHRFTSVGAPASALDFLSALNGKPSRHKCPRRQQQARPQIFSVADEKISAAAATAPLP
jgi:hypothetical protein